MLFLLLDLTTIGIRACMNFTRPSHLSSVTTLPCEIRNIDNVNLQPDITEENGIKFMLASSKCFQRYVPYIYLPLVQKVAHF